MNVVVALCIGQAALVVALLVQRSRRSRVEQALRRSEAARRSINAEAQALAGRLVLSQESERRRIARDLHDNLSQKLAVLCMDISSLGADLSASSTTATVVARLSERARDIADDVYRLSHDLHPPSLELVGLPKAMEGLCREMASRWRIPIAFQNDAVDRVVPTDVALCLFRISQEALQNVVKHSGAAAASVRLRRTRLGVCLHIADSGSGFDVASARGTGLGLLSIRERARLAGGRVAFRSAAGRMGTHVVVDLPMNRPLATMEPGPGEECLNSVRAAGSRNVTGPRAGDSRNQGGWCDATCIN